MEGSLSFTELCEQRLAARALCESRERLQSQGLPLPALGTLRARSHLQLAAAPTLEKFCEMQRQTTQPLTSAKSLHFLPKLCFVLSSACQALAGYHTLGYKAEREAVLPASVTPMERPLGTDMAQCQQCSEECGAQHRSGCPRLRAGSSASEMMS